MSRYSQPDYVMGMNWVDGVDLINQAYSKQSERMAWERWLVDYSHMDKSNFVPFTEYLRDMKNPPIRSTKTDEEIINDAEKILSMLKHP